MSDLKVINEYSVLYLHPGFSGNTVCSCESWIWTCFHFTGSEAGGKQRTEQMKGASRRQTLGLLICLYGLILSFKLDT